MKTQDSSKIIQEFDSIENISPSENWDVNFQNKLDNVQFSKSNSISKFKIMILLLILVNAGFIWNSLKTENTKTIDKGTQYKTIANELLITINN